MEYRVAAVPLVEFDELIPPRSSAYVDRSDPTLPDLLAGGEADTRGAVIAVNASDRPLEDHPALG